MALTADLHNRFCLWVFSQRVLVMSAYIYDPIWLPFKRSVPFSLFLNPSHLDVLSVALTLPRSFYVPLQFTTFATGFWKVFQLLCLWWIDCFLYGVWRIYSGIWFQFVTDTQVKTWQRLKISGNTHKLQSRTRRLCYGNEVFFSV